MDLLELGQGLRSAQAIHLEPVIALELLDRGDELRVALIGVFGAEVSGVVAQVVEPPDLPRARIDRIEFTDADSRVELQGDEDTSELQSRGLISYSVFCT